MTPERSTAYRRLMHLIDGFGADLLAEERSQIRAAADALVLCDKLETDREAREALQVASSLVVRRVVSGSALGTVADRFLIELVSCGPEPAALAPAA